MVQKLDVLLLAAHPDDVELGAAGTVLKLTDMGKAVGIVDLTAGDLGSRGTPELRLEESAAAAQLMGLAARENLHFRDGFFTHDEAHLKAVIRMIRRFQPEVLICNAPEDRHSDHGKGSKLVRDAAFLSGLAKIETEWEGQAQQHWRPKRTFFYIQDYNLQPDFVVDITPYFERKMEVIKAFRSQFYDPSGEGPQTYISSSEFWDWLAARASNMGHIVGVKYGEGFISETALKVETPLDLL
ncbi:MAG: bacillithiol biosynthesis deacetylase BshB1 [Bacteroidota bacterium]